jgi:hypothetical protein
MLRDQAGRQVKIEIVGSHTVSFKCRVSSFKLSCIRFQFKAFNPTFLGCE